LPEIFEKQLHIDPKSRLQELAQEKIGETPIYKVHEEWGPDHAKQFKVGAYIHDKLLGEGSGASKQTAQISAAENALVNWDNLYPNNQSQLPNKNLESSS